MLKKVKLVRLYRMAGQEKPDFNNVAEVIHDAKLVGEDWVQRTNENWLINGGKYYIEVKDEAPKKVVEETKED